MSSWLATILIFLPLGGALFIWLLPVGRLAGSFALALRARRGRLLDQRRSRGSTSTARARRRTSTSSWTWFSDLGVSYHVGFYAFSFWLAGLAVVVMAAAIAYGFWVGRERPRAYFGLMLFLTVCGRGRLRLAGPAALLRLLRGDDDPALRPDRSLGRARDGSGATVKFVIYTMAGSLLMLAAVIVFGLSKGTFDLVDTRHERQHLALPRLRRSPSRSRRRSSRSTAGCRMPTASRRPRSPRCSPA